MNELRLRCGGSSPLSVGAAKRAEVNSELEAASGTSWCTNIYVQMESTVRGDSASRPVRHAEPRLSVSVMQAGQRAAAKTQAQLQ